MHNEVLRHPKARPTGATRLAALAVLASALLAGGCSIFLDPDPQCEVDGDCAGIVGVVCQSGLCVRPETDGGVPDSTDPYVLAYFRSDGTLESDSLHLAFSHDGLNWQTLNSGYPAYTLSGTGENHLRDPFVLRKVDGTFVLIASDHTLAGDAPSSSIIVADSTDLVTFSNARRLEVTELDGPSGMPMRALSPEAFFDASRQEYAIIWSGADETGKSRIYASYTADFQTVSNAAPEVYFDPGYSASDATILPVGDRNYVFYKDASDADGGAVTGSGQDIQVGRTASSTLAAGSFMRFDVDYITRGSSQNARRSTGAPMAFKVPNQNLFIMCADFTEMDGVAGCWRTSDLDADTRTWTELPASDYRFPTDMRHASIVRVSQAELDALVEHYGIALEYNIRTTFTEGAPAEPMYVAHSQSHAMMTFLDDRQAGLGENDFAWRVVPGLADPTDPDLVSFEPVSAPGSYLRIDSVDATRYPTCPSTANRGSALCSLPPIGERNHLAWIDTYVDSATFRSDATFRRVPALNGNAEMVSFQWHGGATRYLKHAYYQMFAPVVSGTTAQNDASFSLEPR